MLRVAQFSLGIFLLIGSLVVAAEKTPSIDSIVKLHEQAVRAQNSGDWQRAEEFHRAILEGARKIPGFPGNEIARALSNWASTLNLLSKHADAERALLEAKDLLKLHPTSDPLQVAVLYGNLGDATARQGRLKEAEQHHQRALQIISTTAGAPESFTASNKAGLAYIFWKRGNLKSSKQYYEEALRVLLPLAGPNHPIVMKFRTEYEIVLQRIESKKAK